ncbi:ComEC family protein [Xenorhabdus sp. SGI246]|uniref:ComEC family protein n=1 Tax=Xenorhabdus sp. SGI246 TaxID=3158263 RepID=UPI00349FAD5D
MQQTILFLSTAFLSILRKLFLKICRRLFCRGSFWQKFLPIINLNQAAAIIILGIVPLLLFGELPQWAELLALAGVAMVLWFIPYKISRFISLILWVLIWGSWHGHNILAQIIYFSETTRSATIIVDSASLNEADREGKTRYRVRLIESDGKYIFPGLYASVSWNSSIPLCAGQKWQVTVKLRPVHAQLNQGSYDSQRYALSIRQPLNGKIIKANLLNGNCNFRQKLINELAPEIQSLKQAGIALALLFGERAWLDKQTRLLLQQTGIAHLMAISGLHITIASLFGWGFARGVQLCFPAKWIGFRFPLLMGWLTAMLYGWLSGWGIPAIRAMLGLTLWIYLRCRNYFCFSWQWALWSAALILLFDPLAILSDSFWLSFFAVMALLFWFHWMPLPEKIRYGWRWSWLRGLHMQSGIMLMLLPLQLLLFQGINIASLIANLWAVPIISFLTVPLIMLALLSAILPLHQLIQPFLWQLVDYTISFALIPLPVLTHSWIETGHIPFFITFACWFFVIAWRLGWWKSYAGLLCASVGVALCYFKRGDEFQWRFSMLDVGHGLSVIIDKGGKAVLFDTGNRWETGSMAEKVIQPYLRWHRLTPEQIILSHDHLDHTGGVEYLREKYPNIQIRSSSIGHTHLPCIRGEKWVWQELTFQVIWPLEKAENVGNNQSCVIRIDDGKHSLLLTGDLEKQGEYRLLGLERENLNATFLQVPHHGSNTSSTAAFIHRVKPEYALVSVARYSPWKLPSMKVRQRYKHAKIQWYSTTFSGQITGYIYYDHIKLEGYRQQLISRWYHQWFGIRGNHE